MTLSSTERATKKQEEKDKKVAEAQRALLLERPIWEVMQTLELLENVETQLPLTLKQLKQLQTSDAKYKVKGVTRRTDIIMHLLAIISGTSPEVKCETKSVTPSEYWSLAALVRDYGLGVLKFHALLVGCDYFPGVHQVGNVKSISILMDAYNEYTRLPTTALLDHLLTAHSSRRSQEA